MPHPLAHLQVLAPPIALRFETAPGRPDGPVRLAFEASGAVSLELELPLRGQRLKLPLAGHIEADGILNEAMRFFIEAADGRIERRAFTISQAFTPLQRLEAKLLPLPATLLTF